MVEAQINRKLKLCIGASISLISKSDLQLLIKRYHFCTDTVAEAANKSPYGILGKTNLMLPSIFDNFREY